MSVCCFRRHIIYGRFIALSSKHANCGSAQLHLSEDKIWAYLVMVNFFFHMIGSNVNFLILAMKGKSLFTFYGNE
jgi:hypothetical protein